MGLVDTLPKRNVIYQGDFQALADKYDELRRKRAGEFIGRDQECVALVQGLTDVGYTGRWQPGPRVIDLAFLLPGTVIANFVFENGKARFPNKRGWHAALFDHFCHGAIMSNGRPCEFSIFDQWHGKPAGRRGLAKSTESWKPAASDDAAAFYVVVVP
jgi:hypothetical protein